MEEKNLNMVCTYTIHTEFLDPRSRLSSLVKTEVSLVIGTYCFNQQDALVSKTDNFPKGCLAGSVERKYPNNFTAIYLNPYF